VTQIIFTVQGTRQTADAACANFVHVTHADIDTYRRPLAAPRSNHGGKLLYTLFSRKIICWGGTNQDVLGQLSYIHHLADQIAVNTKTICRVKSITSEYGQGDLRNELILMPTLSSHGYSDFGDP
jgi:hypothetical protein